jgi:hypothetical protein
VDAIFATVILVLVISGSHFKADSLKWLAKAARLVRASGIAMQDEKHDVSGPVSPISHEGCSSFRSQLIADEERRRLFWLIYCLERHLGLAFNLTLGIPDGTFRVFTPLPERVWDQMEDIPLHCLPPRSFGPPSQISGTGFFEYFLPLMVILGNIMHLHHCQLHPMLGGFPKEEAVLQIESMLSQRQQDLIELDARGRLYSLDESTLEENASYVRNLSLLATDGASGDSRLPFVVSYSTYILHVLYVLLHGKWDPISMIEDNDDWITSTKFVTCASHAISASEALSKILSLDPELVFMPYLFGIYLLQGSFIVLLFADRMPQLGPNKPVAEICETIIRAHEVSAITLDTMFQVSGFLPCLSFLLLLKQRELPSEGMPAHNTENEQKNFRKVLRSMLYDVQDMNQRFGSGQKARRRELLSLYRWTPGSNGLAY